jgi:molybdenum cofactor cytidylyltransferase
MEGLVPKEKAFRVSAVLLAAGAGRRFGDGGKLLASYAGGCLIDGALRLALAAPVDEVVLITGARGGAVGDHALSRFGDPRLRVLKAPDWDDGLSASLRAGLKAVGDADAALVMLGDMPRVPASVLPPLVDAVRMGAWAAAPVFGGRRGHPVVFSAALYPRLLALSGDQGAGRLLAGMAEGLALVAAPDDGVLYDVDTPCDLP